MVLPTATLKGAEIVEIPTDQQMTLRTLIMKSRWIKFLRIPMGSTMREVVNQDSFNQIEVISQLNLLCKE